MISLIASVIIFNTFVIGLVFKHGWLRSVSAYWYRMKNKWIFTIAMWAFSVLLMLAGQTLLICLAGAAICFTAAAANSRALKMTETVHVIGANGGIILGMLALIHLGYWFIAVPQLIFTVLAMKLNMKNHTFWIEVVAFNITALAIYNYIQN